MLYIIDVIAFSLPLIAATIDADAPPCYFAPRLDADMICC